MKPHRKVRSSIHFAVIFFLLFSVFANTSMAYAQEDTPTLTPTATSTLLPSNTPSEPVAPTSTAMPDEIETEVSVEETATQTPTEEVLSTEQPTEIMPTEITPTEITPTATLEATPTVEPDAAELAPAIYPGGEKPPLRIMVPHPDAYGEVTREEIQELHPALTDRSFEPGPFMTLPVNSSVQKSGPAASFKTLAILVEFRDEDAYMPPSYYDNLLFGSEGVTLRTYYDEVSSNQLDIVTVNMPSSLGWYTAPQPMSYYVNNQYGIGAYPNNSQKLAEDMTAAIDDVVDFSQYDNNGDGWVDTIFLIHAGSAAEYLAGRTDLFWSHSWVTHTSPKFDGVYIGSYTVEPEYWRNAYDMRIGVYAHEMGHAFGLPDLYDMDYSSNGVGNWSLMSTGSWLGPQTKGEHPPHPDAWSKVELDFVSPITLTDDASLELLHGGDIYKIQTGYPGEYFLLENRQQLGYDAYLPGEGLLIWHVDTNISGSNHDECLNLTNWQCSPNHFHVALEQADGFLDLEYSRNQGDEYDPFPSRGNNSFSYSTSSSPNNSSYYISHELLWSVTGISRSGDAMNATFNAGLGSTFTTCADQIEIPEAECNVLVDLYNDTNGASWIDNTNWLITDTPCDWSGITCSTGHVTGIELNDNDLGGTLTNLSNLSYLDSLALWSNHLDGAVSSWLNCTNFSDLEYLDLDENNFSGAFPDLSACSNMQALFIENNPLDAGPIPSWLNSSNLPNLVSLGLADIQRTGEIPSELSTLSDLTILMLGGNDFTAGEVPAWINATTYPSMAVLSLRETNRTGSIPATFGDFSSLSVLDLQKNSFSGSIPSELSNLSTLEYLNLIGNQLSGEIPTYLPNLNLETARFDYNMLTASDAVVRAWLDVKDSGWESSQIIMPDGLTLYRVTNTTADLEWSPCLYADDGYFEIGYSTTPGGPYTVYGTTTSEYVWEYTATGLDPGQTYYFAVRAIGNPHVNNPNLLVSDWSGEIIGTTTEPLTIGHYEEDDVDITLSGVWGTAPSGAASGGTFVYSSDNSARVAFTFIGSHAVIHRNVGGDYGGVRVWVDGSLYGTMQNYVRSHVGYGGYPIMGLADGKHDVELVFNSGSYMGLDAIDVVESLGIGRYDDADTRAMAFDRGWNQVSGDSYYNNTVTYTNYRYATITFPVNGTDIILLHSMNPNMLGMELYVDGVFHGNVSNYRATRIAYQAGTMINGLSAGEHVIELRNTTDREMDIDGLVVLSPFTADTVAGDDHQNLAFNGEWLTYSMGNLHDGNMHWTSDPHACIKFTFEGTTAKLMRALGPDRGEATVSVDGSAYGTMNNYLGNGLGFQSGYLITGLSDSTHVAEMCFSDGYFMDLDAVVVYDPVTSSAGQIDDSDIRIAFNGSWDVANMGGPVNSTMHYSSKENATVWLRFNGTGVDITRFFGADRGDVDVYIDGGYNSTYSSYSESAAFQQVTSISGLGAGDHTLELRNASPGTYISVDAITVTD